MKATIMKSLAETGRNYVRVFMRIKGGKLHLQVAGPEENRSYGAALDSTVCTTLKNWIIDINHLYPSLAGTGKSYIVGRAVVNGDWIHVQVSFLKKLNRTYGAAFDIPINDDDKTGVANCINRALAREVEKDYETCIDELPEEVEEVII